MVVRELITLLGFKLEDGPQRQYDKQIDATKEKSNGLATAARGVGSAYKWAAAAVAVGVGWISKNIIEATLEMEGYRTQIQAFTGDADSAAETLAELRDKTIDPLFGTGNLVNAYKQLRTVGMGAEESSRMIDVLGDVANGSVENFNALNNVLLRAASTGKVNEGTMRQLAQAGFGAQDMAQGLGISVGQLNKDLADGKIGFAELTRAMEGATQEGGRFYMNAANQALTLGGAIKILQDSIGSIGDAIGTKVAPALASVIRYVTNFIKLGSEGLTNFGAKAFETLLKRIADVIIFFAMLRYRLREYGGAFDALKGIFQDVFGFLESVIQSAEPFLMNLAVLFIAAFKPIRAFVRPVLEALKPVFQNVFGVLSSIIERLIPLVDGLTPLFGALGRIVGGLLGPILGVALAIRGVNTAIAIGKGAVAGIKAVQTAYGLLTGTMSVMRAAAEGNRLALLMLDAQMLKAKISSIALAVVQKAQAIATGIASAATAVFNAIMAVNPIVLIVMGVIALIAAIVLLVKNWDKVKAGFASAGKAIGNFFAGAGSKIKSFAGAVAEKVGPAFNSLKTKASESVQKMVAAFAGRFPNLYRFIVDLISKIKEIFGKLVSIIRPPVEAAINVVKTVFGSAIDVVKEIGVSIFNVFKTIFTSVWNVIKTIFTSIWNVIKTVFDSIKNVVMTVFNVFKTIFFSIFNVIKGVFTTIFDTVFSIFDGIIGIWSGGGNFFTKLWESIKLVFTSVWNGILKIIHIVADAFMAIWGSVKDVFAAILRGWANIFSSLWDGIVNVFSSVVEGIIKIFSSIINGVKNVLGKIKIGIVKFVNAVKELWKSLVNAIKAVVQGLVTVLQAVWDAIKRAAVSLWEGIKAVVVAVVDGIKAAWNGITGFFSDLWENIKNIAASIWEGIKGIVSGVVDGIKDIWNGLTDFFTGLWDALKESPAAALEFIKNAFLGLFDNIKNVFFGFIDKIKEGWDTVKGFLGGVVEGAVNFVTGGGGEPAARPVNDLIVTPEGRYSTHPDDYVMAMKNPGDLVDSILRFLGAQQPEPAYAGAGGSLVSKAVSAAAGNVYNNGGNSQIIEAKTSITVNVPQGTPAQQAEAISRQVEQKVLETFAGAVNGSRGAIPSPEARRN